MPRGEHPNSRANLERGKRFHADSARKAAEKSNEKQRQKRAAREVVALILDAPVAMEPDKKKKLGDALGIAPQDIDNRCAALFAQMKNALKGDLKALEYLMAFTGENPDQKANAQSTTLEKAHELLGGIPDALE